MRDPAKMKFPLADEVIGKLFPSSLECEELHRVCQDKDYWQLYRVIFTLMKLGESPKRIMALCNIADRLYERVATGIKASKFLYSAIQDALAAKTGALVERTAEDVLEGEIIEDDLAFEDEVIPEMQKKLKMLLASVDIVKISEASLRDISDAYSKIFDKMRLAQNKTTANIMGVQVLQTSAAQDAKRLQTINKQILELKKMIGALKSGPEESPAGTTFETTRPTGTDQRT